MQFKLVNFTLAILLLSSLTGCDEKTTPGSSDTSTRTSSGTQPQEQNSPSVEAKKENPTTPPITEENNSQTKNDCNQEAFSDNTTGGCRIRLVTPTPCEEIDLSNGRAQEFAWTTDGTYCETPFKLGISGNPPDLVGGTNSVSWSFTTYSGRVTHYGGYTTVTAAELSGLSTENGIYHWGVQGWFGSHPASQTFRVKK